MDARKNGAREEDTRVSLAHPVRSCAHIFIRLLRRLIIVWRFTTNSETRDDNENRVTALI